MVARTSRVTSALPIVFVLRGDQFAVLASGETQVNLTTIPVTAVTSWNGRTGAVLPAPGDYDAADVGATTPAQVDAAIALAIAAIPPAAWGTITGALGDQADLAAALSLLAPLASPALAGVPTAPTAVPGTGTTQLATTEFVGAAVAAAVAGLPDPAFAEITGDPGDNAALAAALADKAPLASPTFTGDPRAPTPSTGDSDASIATTAFVHAAIGTPTGPVAGVTSAPVAPGAFAVVPEMTTSHTPVRTWCWVDFEIAVTLAPGASGATIGVDFRITADGVAVPASTRRESLTADGVLALVPGAVTRIVAIRRRLTGLSAGAPVTIAVEWMEVAGSNGTVTGRLAERSLTVSDA